MVVGSRGQVNARAGDFGNRACLRNFLFSSLQLLLMNLAVHAGEVIVAACSFAYSVFASHDGNVGIGAFTVGMRRF